MRWVNFTELKSIASVARMLDVSWATARDFLKPLEFYVVRGLKRYKVKDIEELLELSRRTKNGTKKVHPHGNADTQGYRSK